MSLLLEALKKSEDERAQRRSGQPVYAGSNASGNAASNKGLLLAVLVLGGVAAGLAAWVFIGGGANKPAATQQSKAESLPSTGAAPVAAPSPASAAVSAAQAAVTPPEPATVTPPTAAKPEATQTAAADNAQAASPAGNRSLYQPGGPRVVSPPVTAKDTPAPAPAPATPAAAKPAAVVTAKPAGGAVAPQAAASASAAGAKPVAQKPNTPTSSPSITINNAGNSVSTNSSIKKLPNTNEILLLSDLPPEISAELPAFRFSGYMHAEDGNERLIGINDKLVRVGDEVAPGLRVQSLSPNVVVFTYKGYRFRVSQ